MAAMCELDEVIDPAEIANLDRAGNQGVAIAAAAGREEASVRGHVVVPHGSRQTKDRRLRAGGLAYSVGGWCG